MESGRVNDRFRPRFRSPLWIFIGQPFSFGRTSDIPTATAAYLRGNTPATHLLTFRHATISDIQLPAFTRHDSPTFHTHPHVGAKLYTTNDSRMTSPYVPFWYLAAHCFLARKMLYCARDGCTKLHRHNKRFANYLERIAADINLKGVPRLCV